MKKIKLIKYTQKYSSQKNTYFNIEEKLLFFAHQPNLMKIILLKRGHPFGRTLTPFSYCSKNNPIASCIKIEEGNKQINKYA